jgi:hypothetical protein
MNALFSKLTFALAHLTLRTKVIIGILILAIIVTNTLPQKIQDPVILAGALVLLGLTSWDAFHKWRGRKKR